MAGDPRIVDLGESPRADLTALLARFDEFAPFTALPAAERLVLARSGWSIAQHLEHTLRAAELNLRAIEAIEHGRGDPTTPPWGPEAGPLLRSGVIPRGVADSPESVRPAARPDVPSLEPMRREQTSRWRSLAKRLSSLDRLDGTIPHPLLGPLSARAWLRFARVHTDHHARIIKEIAGDDSSPP